MCLWAPVYESHGWPSSHMCSLLGTHPTLALSLSMQPLPSPGMPGMYCQAAPGSSNHTPGPAGGPRIRASIHPSRPERSRCPGGFAAAVARSISGPPSVVDPALVQATGWCIVASPACSVPRRARRKVRHRLRRCPEPYWTRRWPRVCVSYPTIATPRFLAARENRDT